MKVLVTGGAGFIGANLVRMLIEKSYRVSVLDDLSAGNLDYLAGLKLGFVEDTVLNPFIISQMVDWADSVIHLAAQTGIVNSFNNPHHDCTINVTGTLNVLDICRQAKIRRFVFTSSNAAIGPFTPYGASKRAAEGYCLAYRNSYGLDTVVLRLANVYGPFSMHKNSVCAEFFKDILHEREITIEGDGRQTRDFIHVNDVCQAIIMALESDIIDGVFQIGTAIQASILELAAMIAHHAPDVDVKYKPSRQSDIQRSRSDITRAKKILDWEPKVNLSDGLKSTWEWFNDNHTGIGDERSC